MMNFKAPRGTHDILGAQAERMHGLEEASRGIFNSYGVSEIRVPSFEDAGLFTRSIGEATDIVEKEMYVFEDRKGRRLALRPEGTASVVRAYLENQLALELPVGKLFYIGPMFRYERPQAGRYREFFQIGMEYFGNAYPSADAETILVARDILKAAGLKDLDVHLNTLGCAACRPAFRQAITDYFSSRQDLCGDCQRRLLTNPLRLLDCKVDGPKFGTPPKMEDFLCGECRDHFARVRSLLDAAGCSYHIDHRLVRGLDYYTRTIFEIRSSHAGAQDALAAGGRYDTLVKELGGPDTPSVGFALGSERVLLAVENQGGPREEKPRECVFVAAAQKELEKEAFVFAQKLRQTARSSRSFSVEGPFAERSLKSQMKLADKLNAKTTYIFGEAESRRGTVIERDMVTKEQSEITVEKVLSGISR